LDILKTYGEALKIAVNHIDVDVNLGVECWENFASTLYILSKLVIHVYCSISFGQFLFFFCFAEWKNVRYPGASKDKDSSFHYPLRFFFLYELIYFRSSLNDGQVCRLESYLFYQNFDVTFVDIIVLCRLKE